MPLPSLCGESDVREGIKVPGSILEFHFPLPLPIPSCCFSSERGKRGEREKGGEHAPEFPEHPSNREAQRRRVGRSPQPAPHPAVPSLSPGLSARSRYALLPRASLRLSAPAYPAPGLAALPSSPFLQCLLSPSSHLLLLSPRRKGCGQGGEPGPYPAAKPPATQLGKETACARTLARD